jgi:hypothetical protein
MDCATIADGKLDECVKLPGKQIEMSARLSKVKTDPKCPNVKISIFRFTLKPHETLESQHANPVLFSLGEDCDISNES